MGRIRAALYLPPTGVATRLRNWPNSDLYKNLYIDPDERVGAKELRLNQERVFQRRDDADLGRRGLSTLLPWILS